MIAVVAVFGASREQIDSLIEKGANVSLIRSDAEVLLAFIKSKKAPDGVNLDTFHALRNDAADVLLAQKAPVPGLERTMLSVIEDPKHDLVWREYVIQKLPDLYWKVNHDKARSRVLKMLKSKSTDKEYLFSGTALLGLYRLSQSDAKPVSEAEVKDRAWEIIENDAFLEANRISALQIGAKLGCVFKPRNEESQPVFEIKFQASSRGNSRISEVRT